MKIHGLTVSVDYADVLAKSLDTWLLGLDSLTIVTSVADSATRALARPKVQFFTTDAFYENGAAFNKGAAQQKAWGFVPKDDWILLFDADITPPATWKAIVRASQVEPRFLYGCRRWDESGAEIRDDSHGYGYFQLFHASDPLAQVEPFFDTCWTHAGCGDGAIMLRWKDAGKLAPALPIKLTHAGIGPSHNWYGVGKEAEFEAMQRERAKRGGGWKSLAGEVISGSCQPALLNR